MSTAELVALQLRLEFERSMRNHEDALALGLIDRLKRENVKGSENQEQTGGKRV